MSMKFPNQKAPSFAAHHLITTAFLILTSHTPLLLKQLNMGAFSGLTIPELEYLE